MKAVASVLRPRGPAHPSGSLSVAEKLGFAASSRQPGEGQDGGGAWQGWPSTHTACVSLPEIPALSQPGGTFPSSWPRGSPSAPLRRWKLPQVALGLRPALPKALAKDRSPAEEASCRVWVSCGSRASPVPLRCCPLAQRPGQECSVCAGVEGAEWGWVECASAVCVLGIRGRAQALGRRFRGPPEDGQGCGMSEGSSPDTSVLGCSSALRGRHDLGVESVSD